MNKHLITATAILSLVSACAIDPTPEQSGAVVRDELAQVLQTLEPIQPVQPAAKEEVEIPRHAPWLADRFDARYADTSKEAIKTVLQGRPVIFELRRETNPQVTSPIDAVTIKQHLDAIAVQSDWSYLVDEGVVVFTDTNTEQFFIQSIPGIGISRVAFNTLGNGGNAGGQVTGASNSLELSSTPYIDLQNLLRSVVADYIPEGADLEGSSMFALIPSANILTVNGSPSLLRRVKRIIDDFNYSVTRKVHLIITVYDVTFSDVSARSIDFNVLRQAAIRTSSGFTGSSLIPATDGALSLGLDFFEGNSLDSSSVIFNLLRQQGQTTVKLHEAFEATNNVVFSIEDQRTTPYISQVSIQRQDGGAISQITPTIETDEVSTGLGFHVVATIANDNINIRLSLSQSTLVRFDPYNFGTGENGISGSLPVTDNQYRVIPISLRDGETRLIANLSQSQYRNEEAGFGFGDIGRSNGRDNTEKQTVIAVTAKIL
ncbi:MAG: hypothetical protein JKY40_10615 [Gammaproteobacteria bacterium]|nr:hypothetical protein [Gammaproteobacteria bacterium]MBL4729738.1 hypothetical protein [Gammaproteobacteria bacterium]